MSQRWDRLKRLRVCGGPPVTADTRSQTRIRDCHLADQLSCMTDNSDPIHAQASASSLLKHHNISGKMALHGCRPRWSSSRHSSPGRIGVGPQESPLTMAHCFPITIAVLVLAPRNSDSATGIMFKTSCGMCCRLTGLMAGQWIREIRCTIARGLDDL